MYNVYTLFQDSTLRKTTKSSKSKDATERLIGMTNVLSKYLEAKTQLQQSTPSASLASQPRLDYYNMWANYETMMRTLDENEIVDLNIELTNVIGAAVKRKREKEQSK